MDPLAIGETEDRSAPSPRGPQSRRTTRATRWKAASFAFLFVLYVMTSLVGYRYAINTEANMWYLFQVAKHTSAVLVYMGERSAVEPYNSGFRAAEKGPQLSKWRGKKAAIATSPNPGQGEEFLSRKEIWYYKAYALLERGGSLQDFGPFVLFVAKKGLNTRIQGLRRELLTLRRDNSRQPNEKAEKKKGIEAKLESLTEQVAQLPKTDKGLRQRKDNSFNFIVVPDCGAIPSLSIFAAAVLAFPTRWWKRLAGLAFGLPLLYAVNLGRLSTLAYIGAFDPTAGRVWFSFSHEYVWQGIFIVFVVAIWMVWIELLVRRGRVK